MIQNTLLIKIEPKEMNPLFFKIARSQFIEFIQDLERIDTSFLTIPMIDHASINKYDIERILVYNYDGVKQLFLDHVHLRLVDSNNQFIKAEI